MPQTPLKGAKVSGDTIDRNGIKGSTKKDFDRLWRQADDRAAAEDDRKSITRPVDRLDDRIADRTAARVMRPDRYPAADMQRAVRAYPRRTGRR